jgi:DHA2 family multidrug resistance protein
MASESNTPMSATSIILIVTAAMAALLEIIDSSIVNVAIPTMMGNLGVTLDDIGWVSTSYMIANSIVLPIAAWLGTRLGRRTYFTAAILAFTAASFACGIAPNLPMLIVFRIIQGLAGGALLPTSQTLIQEQFPAEKAGMASAIFGMSIMIGPALGPVLGGYLTDNFGWRSIFNINVPLGLAAAFMSTLHVKDMPGSEEAKAKATQAGVDWTGLALLCIGVGFFQLILERGQTEGWWDSNLIRASGVLAVFGITGFILWETKIENPIMNLRLFKENAVSSGTLLMLALGLMLYSVTFVVPVFVANVMRMTATQTGLLFIPGAIFSAITMMIAGNAIRIFNPKHLVILGMSIAESCLITMSHFTTQTGPEDMFLPLVLRGAAMGFLFIPINGMVLSQFRGERLSQVSGMMNFFRQIGGSIGIASLDTLMTRFGTQNYLELSAKVTALNPIAYNDYNSARGIALSKMSQAIGMGTPDTMAVTSLYGRVMRQVFILSFSQLCWVIIFTFGLGLIPLYLIKAPKRLGGKVDMGH